jgi:hypothetical protein
MNTAAALTLRRLQVDLTTPFARRWNGGDAFRTALFNARSMRFPAGEQLFIDSLLQGLGRAARGRTCGLGQRLAHAVRARRRLQAPAAGRCAPLGLKALHTAASVSM